MNDILTRLRSIQNDCLQYSLGSDIIREAADKIAALQEERDQLKAVLQDVNTSDYRFSVEQLSQHDAAIERFCDYAKTKYSFGLHTLAKEFSQVNQQTIHGRD